MLRMFSRVEPMQDRCGATSSPSALICCTISRLRSCVEPPAPKVTEKNSGWSAASCLRVAASFSTPSGVCGGKNSKLKSGLFMVFPHDLFAHDLHRSCAERPRKNTVQGRAEHAVPEAVHDKAAQHRSDEPEQQAVDDENKQPQRDQRDRQREQQQ